MQEEGLVGESATTSALEIEGYRLIETPDTEYYEFEEEQQTVIYKYEKIIFNISTEVEGGGGTIEGDEDAPYGNSSTKDRIRIKADKGYVISRVVIDDHEIRIKDNQTELIIDNFEFVKENHKIVVAFLPYNPETFTSIKNILIVITLLAISLLYHKRHSFIKR